MTVTIRRLAKDIGDLHQSDGAAKPFCTWCSELRWPCASHDLAIKIIELLDAADSRFYHDLSERPRSLSGDPTGRLRMREIPDPDLKETT